MPKLKGVQIELTGRCNENCVHCYIPQDDRNHDMDSALLERIIDQCGKMGAERITFSGGEPMLHPDFLKAVVRANCKGLKVRILSNLLLLDDNKLATLKECHIHEIQTSLYSTEPTIHDAITQIFGSCERTKQGIAKLTQYGIPVFISCPITTINKNSYPVVLDFAKRFGASSVPDNMILAQSDGNGKNLEYRLNIDEALQVIQDILDNDTAYDHERFSPNYNNIEEALPCVQNICSDAICINAKGEVIPQPEWYKVLGDLNNQTLKDIWENSPEIKSLREINLKRFPKCESCPAIQFCGMDLGANANENLSRDPFVIPEHICILAESTRKLVHSHKSKLSKETA